MTDVHINVHTNKHGEISALSFYQKSPSKGLIVIPFKSIQQRYRVVFGIRSLLFLEPAAEQLMGSSTVVDVLKKWLQPLLDAFLGIGPNTRPRADIMAACIALGRLPTSGEEAKCAETCALMRRQHARAKEGLMSFYAWGVLTPENASNPKSDMVHAVKVTDASSAISAARPNLPRGMTICFDEFDVPQTVDLKRLDMAVASLERTTNAKFPGLQLESIKAPTRRETLSAITTMCLSELEEHRENYLDAISRLNRATNDNTNLKRSCVDGAALKIEIKRLKREKKALTEALKSMQCLNDDDDDGGVSS